MTRHDDRGAVTLIALGFAMVFLLVAAVLVDGGMRLVTIQRATDEAAATAQRALKGIDVEHDEDGGLVLDATTATADANDFLARFGHAGSVTVEGTTVTVSVRIPYEARLLRFLSGDVKGTATATPIEGGQA